MKTGVIFSVPLNTTREFGWRWRSGDFEDGSIDSFRFYAECVADAERKGYKVQLGRIESRGDPAREEA